MGGGPKASARSVQTRKRDHSEGIRPAALVFCMRRAAGQVGRKGTQQKRSVVPAIYHLCTPPCDEEESVERERAKGVGEKKKAGSEK